MSRFLSYIVIRSAILNIHRTHLESGIRVEIPWDTMYKKGFAVYSRLLRISLLNVHPMVTSATRDINVSLMTRVVRKTFRVRNYAGFLFWNHVMFPLCAEERLFIAIDETHFGAAAVSSDRSKRSREDLCDERPSRCPVKVCMHFQHFVHFNRHPEIVALAGKITTDLSDFTLSLAKEYGIGKFLSSR